MYPEKLKKGDGIRIVSPATSMSVMTDENINAAKTKLEELGFCVSFSEHSKEINEFDSSSIESRVRDLHEAFADPDIKAILTTLGGFQSNQLLRYLDYETSSGTRKSFAAIQILPPLAMPFIKKPGLSHIPAPIFLHSP